MKKTALAAALALSLGTVAVTAQAGTAGLTGVWSGTYSFSMTSPGGGAVGATTTPQAWSFDFTNHSVSISNTTTFYAAVWTSHSITIADNGDGTYGNNIGAPPANMLFDWSINTNIPVAELWDVTATGNTATVSAVSALILPSTTAFPGFHPAFNGTLSAVPVPAVPVPAAAWLFGSGLLGLVGVARRRKVS